MNTDITMKRYIYLLVGTLALFFMGCCYTWGIFVVPLEKMYGWKRVDTSLAFTLCLIFFAFGTILAGTVSRIFSFANLMRLSGILIGAGFLLTSFVENVYFVFFSYSVICGTGIGIGYNSALSSFPRWFPEKMSFATGTMLVGYAISTTIFAPVINTLIETVGLPWAFRLVGLICVLGIFITSLFNRLPSENENKALPQLSCAKQCTGYDIETKQMLRLPRFWLTFFLFCFVGGTGLVVVNHITPILTEEVGATTTFAAMAISLSFIFNSGGRIAGGILADKVGSRHVLLINSILMCLSMFVFILGLWWKNALILVMACTICMAVFGSNANMIASATRELFGQKYFSMNFSAMNMYCLPASLLPTVAGLLHVYTDGYIIPFYALGVLSLINIMLGIHIVKSNSIGTLI